MLDYIVIGMIVLFIGLPILGVLIEGLAEIWPIVLGIALVWWGF